MPHKPMSADKLKIATEANPKLSVRLTPNTVEALIKHQADLALEEGIEPTLSKLGHTLIYQGLKAKGYL